MMKQTIRNLLLLTAMIIVGAGQVWANVPDPTYGILGYSSENAATDGGVLEFYNNADCVEDDNGNHKLSKNEAVLQSWLNADRTVYIKALPDAIHTLGEDALFITVEKTQAANNINAPRRTPEVGDYCEVTAVQGKAGVYQFTMPDEANINVKVTVTFKDKAYQTKVAYVNENGESTTTLDGMKIYVLDGTETTLGVEGTESWYISNIGGEGIAYTSQLNIKGTVRIILADDSKMTLTNSSSNYGIKAENTNFDGFVNLAIYGQSESNGILDVNCNNTGDGLVCGIDIWGHLTICGGNVKVQGAKIGINGHTSGIVITGGTVTAIGDWWGIDGTGGDVIIRGGNVTATGGTECGIYAYNNAIISGGKVTATGTKGISAYNGNITLGWSTADDYIKASSYSYEGTLNTTDGKRFVANIVSGDTESTAAYINGGLTLTNGQCNYLAGKKLTPMSDEIVESLTYIDVNGEEQNIFTDIIANSDPVENFTYNDFLYILQGNETTLGNGGEYSWYICNTDGEGLLFSNPITLNGDVYFILADDANMFIGSEETPVEGKGISASNNEDLSIYGQKEGNGKLTVYSKDRCISLPKNSLSNLDIYGGEITLKNDYENSNADAIYCYCTNIYRGSVVVKTNGIGIKTPSDNDDGMAYMKTVEVYGGSVNIESKSNGIESANIKIYDGSVTAKAENPNQVGGCIGLNGVYSVIIDGGQVSAIGDDNDDAGGIKSASVTLDWKNSANSVYATKYNATNVKIKAGKHFIVKSTTEGVADGPTFGSNDEDDFAFVTNDATSDDFIGKIAGKTLVPTMNVPAPIAVGATTPSAYVPLGNLNGKWSVSGSEVKKVLVPYGLNADCSVATKEVEVSGSATLPEATPLILETAGSNVIDFEGSNLLSIDDGLQNILNDLGDTYEKTAEQAAEAAAIDKTPEVTPALFLGGDGQQTVAEQVAKAAKALLGATIPENPTPNDLSALAKDFLYFKTQPKANGNGGTDLVLRAAAVDLTSPATIGAIVMAINKMSFINLMHLQPIKECNEGAPRLGGIYLDLGDDLTGIIEHELLNSYEYSKSGWYTVDGRKLDKQPTAKGLYIRNGRKVVIK